jgi:glutaredoxin-related protein
MSVGICLNCKKNKEIADSGKSKGLCHTCYKKLLWKPKLIECRRCKRVLPVHAKSLCLGCYSSVFQIDNVKKWNAQLYHKIDHELYKKATTKCTICGFDKIVELHHLDNNHNNNSETNLIGACPNHHKMLHHRDFRKEMFDILKEKGFKIPAVYKDDEFFKTS